MGMLSSSSPRPSGTDVTSGTWVAMSSGIEEVIRDEVGKGRDWCLYTPALWGKKCQLGRQSRRPPTSSNHSNLSSD